MCAPPLLPKKPEDWEYHTFNIEQSGIEFRRRDGELHELVIVRNAKVDHTQAIFVTFPDLWEYYTKDLFSKHPTKQNLWKYGGNLDDVLVLSSGKKLNPVTIERIITCPEVTGCVLVGQGRFQTAALIEVKEPPKSDADEERLSDIIWPFVKRANESCIAHGRIAKDLLLFTSTGKPLPRAGRGTVQRQRSVLMYDKEIDELYQGLNVIQNPTTAGLNLRGVESTKPSL